MGSPLHPHGSLYHILNFFVHTTNIKRPVFEHNTALAYIFHQMGACYRYLGGNDRFRAIAYENASRLLQNMPEDIAVYARDIETLEEMKYIGTGIAAKIMEYLRTGKVAAFEALKKKVPYTLLELMDITGFGPATIKLLYEQLHIGNRNDLVQALETGRLNGEKGFGAKRIEQLKQALKMVKSGQRLLLADAQQIASRLLAQMLQIPGVEQAAIAGSIRRKKETIGDIDMVVVAPPAKRKSIVQQFISGSQVARVLVKGSTRVSVVLKKPMVQVDVRLVQAHEFGAALLYFTGPREYTIGLRTLARERGLKINEYGIFDVHNGRRLGGATEEEIFAALQLNYVPPEERRG